MSKADELLAAHVEFVLSDLTVRFPSLLPDWVDEVLELLGEVTVEQALEPAAVKRAALRVVHNVTGSPAVADLVTQLSDSLYALAASDEYTLGQVIPRKHVEALLDKFLSMEDTHAYFLDRAAESPLLSQVVSTLVGRVVGDFLDQSRQKAEKIPGMGLALSLGGKAANAAKGVAGSALEDLSGKGAQATLRRTNKVTGEILRDPATKAGLLEFWDLHAGDSIGALRNYVTTADATELVGLVHELNVDVRSSKYVGAVIDQAVDVFFARYGEWDLTSMLAELGIDRDEMVEDVTALAAPALQAARDNGTLATFVKARLQPFYESKAVASILS